MLFRGVQTAFVVFLVVLGAVIAVAIALIRSH
jgi:hypothetical protein